MPPTYPWPLALSLTRGSPVRVGKASKLVAVRARVLAPREVLSRAVALGRRELLVEPGGLHPVLAQERVGGGETTDAAKTATMRRPLHRTSLPGRKGRHTPRGGICH